MATKPENKTRKPRAPRVVSQIEAEFLARKKAEHKAIIFAATLTDSQMIQLVREALDKREAQLVGPMVTAAS